MKILGIIALVMAGGSFGVATAGLFSAAREEKRSRAAELRARELFGVSDMGIGKVMFIGFRLHQDNPEQYPPAGTVGDIIKIHEEHQHVLVRWPEGTTSEDGVWWVRTDAIVPATLIDEEE